MPVEFAEALAGLLSAAVPLGVRVAEADVAYSQGGPGAGTVTWMVGYRSVDLSNLRLITVEVDIDVWTRGPDRALADDIASAVETALIGQSVETARQGTVRIRNHQRVPVPSLEDNLAHLSMRFTGRAFRRLES